MIVEINGRPVTAIEADGVHVQDYISLHGDGIMIVLTTGKRHKLVKLSSANARAFATGMLALIDQHEALMVASDDETGVQA